LEKGKRVRAFVADPGRLQELLYPGARVFLAHADGRGRRTDYDLRLVESDGNLVSVDSRVPNKIVAKALKAGALEPLSDYREIKSEPRTGAGRLDFMLTGKGLPPCYLEVKSCTLVRDRLALFPDAPTARGTRHLKELTTLKKEGYRSAVLFVIQHPGASSFTPNKATDPEFSRALHKASRAGVEVYAYKCLVTLEAITLGPRVMVTI